MGRSCANCKMTQKSERHQTKKIKPQRDKFYCQEKDVKKLAAVATRVALICTITPTVNPLRCEEICSTVALFSPALSERNFLCIFTIADCGRKQPRERKKESEFHPRWEICGQYVTAVYCCADTRKKGSASIK